MTYYDLPLLKPPVWTCEIPAYFFVGGAAGAAAMLGAAAQLTGDNEKLVSDARWIALIGAGLSGPLLISDLGRPERFLNMLRVFKPQSPMSVGVWTLVVFSGATAGAVLLPWKPLKNLAGLAAAATGLGMATYTGVLLGVSAIPVWKEHADFLPIHFGASALGSAVSLLELRGHKRTALNQLALGASLFESAADHAVEADSTLLRIAGALSGPVPFFLRLFGKRKAAAAATLLGSLATRFAWVEAGKQSANDADVALRGPRT
ncbi:MAG TPA: NrfD/PsrC family molybdoenzyme membrane anchor subunit [Thermoanaerobaculia bacterium]|nr:NrfD/PsrC family molybdoenzyme membrane anchor subunit [Thermoanaerobaculia bacterium]